MLTKWKGDTAIEYCEDPDLLLRFLTRRIPQIHEWGDGDPYEGADFADAVARLIELANQGKLPMRWQREHLKRLIAGIRPVEE
jgi:hypothetical protein